MYRIGLVLFLLFLGIGLPADAGSLTVQVFRGNREPLPDAAIYLMANQSDVPLVPGSYEIVQKNKMFFPFVMVLPTGSKVSFLNRDGIGHHIYSLSVVKNFQLPLSEQVSTGVVSFDQPGLVTLGCNIHDWMAAYIYVVDTPWFGKSAADGMAFIEDLPDGEYTLHVAHPGMKAATPLTRRVIIASGAGAREEFSLDLKPEYFWRPAPREDEEAY